MKKVSVVALCVVALLVFLGETRTAEAVTCSPSELTPCLGAINSGSPPSAACCTKLKEQKPCLCGYLQNPSLKQYINNPNTKKVGSACGVALPKC